MSDKTGNRVHLTYLIVLADIERVVALKLNKCVSYIAQQVQSLDDDQFWSGIILPHQQTQYEQATTQLKDEERALNDNRKWLLVVVPVKQKLHFYNYHDNKML